VASYVRFPEAVRSFVKAAFESSVAYLAAISPQAFSPDFDHRLSLLKAENPDVLSPGFNIPGNFHGFRLPSV
jgi:hypothetical protein